MSYIASNDVLKAYKNNFKNIVLHIILLCYLALSKQNTMSKNKIFSIRLSENELTEIDSICVYLKVKRSQFIYSAIYKEMILQSSRMTKQLEIKFND